VTSAVPGELHFYTIQISPLILLGQDFDYTFSGYSRVTCVRLKTARIRRTTTNWFFYNVHVVPQNKKQTPAFGAVWKVPASHSRCGKRIGLSHAARRLFLVRALIPRPFDFQATSENRRHCPSGGAVRLEPVSPRPIVSSPFTFPTLIWDGRSLVELCHHGKSASDQYRLQFFYRPSRQHRHRLARKVDGAPLPGITNVFCRRAEMFGTTVTPKAPIFPAHHSLVHGTNASSHSTRATRLSLPCRLGATDRADFCDRSRGLAVSAANFTSKLRLPRISSISFFRWKDQSCRDRRCGASYTIYGATKFGKTPQWVALLITNPGAFAVHVHRHEHFTPALLSVRIPDDLCR